MAYRVWLEGEVATSWNTYHGRAHWAKRKENSDRVLVLMKYMIDEQRPSTGKPLDYPVNITITSWRKRLIDADNIVSKMYIDGLVRNGIIHDDTPEWVWAVTTKSRKADKLNPAGVLIEFEQAYN